MDCAWTISIVLDKLEIMILEFFFIYFIFQNFNNIILGAYLSAGKIKDGYPCGYGAGIGANHPFDIQNSIHASPSLWLPSMLTNDPPLLLIVILLAR